MKPLDNSTLQREALPEDEEELQMKPLDNSTLQREALPEDEEELQMKSLDNSTLQREALPEDEEELQMKPLDNSTLQREALPEEEEELQMKSLDNSTLQREALPEDEEELQMKPMVQRQAEAGMEAAPDLEASINQARGGGQAIADNIREPMEVAFGADFSGVKVHTDGQSDQLNRSIQARAFTTGQDVFFRSGEYNPGSRGGQELLAHELTHVVQQNGGAVQRSPLFPEELQRSTKPEESELQAQSTLQHRGAIGGKVVRKVNDEGKKKIAGEQGETPGEYEYMSDAGVGMIKERDSIITLSTLPSSLWELRDTARQENAQSPRASIVQRQIYYGQKASARQANVSKIRDNDLGIRAVIDQWATSNEADYYFTDQVELIKKAGEVATSRLLSQQGKLPDVTGLNLENTNKKINDYVAHQIGPGNVTTVNYNHVQTWADWYFSQIEYQNNKTQGWHGNRNSWLPGAPTDDGKATRYVEFRRPGAYGENERTKLERCIFDIIEQRCWPNAHYDGGYVEITNVPATITNKLMWMAWGSSNGMRDHWKSMNPQPAAAGNLAARNRAILDSMRQAGL
ncbi:DUF4157 domain-containing protein [Nostoc sp. TCL240-02]|nr:DUF4157 domain-containing protein [Nostoc sp. TCL240-02]